MIICNHCKTFSISQSQKVDDIMCFRNCLWQTARTILLNQDTVSQMVEDLEHVDINKVVLQAAIAQPKMGQESVETVHHCTIFLLNHFHCLINAAPKL